MGMVGVEPTYHLLTPLSRLGWRAFPLGYIPEFAGIARPARVYEEKVYEDDSCQM